MPIISFVLFLCVFSCFFVFPLYSPFRQTIILMKDTAPGIGRRVPQRNGPGQSAGKERLTMATMKDIADHLGVSVSTVSKGLSGAPDVSESLRKDILETAVEIGYKNGRAQKKHNRKMALLIENISYESPEDFGYDILMGFRKAARQAYWDVDAIPLTKEMQEKEDYEHFLLQRKYSGAFILGFSLEDPWMSQMTTAGHPTVLLDNSVPLNPHVGMISTDSQEAVDMAVSYLADLRHEKIAFLNGSAGSMISDARMGSFLQSMAGHGLRVDPDMAVYGYYVEDCAKYHVPGFLLRGATAILCGNDLIAAGVIKSCREAGYRVPEDVSVIGFDDIPLAERLAPPLTTILQDRFYLGKCAFYSLSAMIDRVPVSRTLLRPVLIERGSCAIAKPRLAEPCEPDPDSVRIVNPALYAHFA